MFDPKKYDTRMRDPEGKRRKPAGEEGHRRLPREATVRRRTEERFDEKRPEQPMPKPVPARSERRLSGSRTGLFLALVALLLLIVWRFAVGEVGQGLVLLVVGALGVFWVGTRRGTPSAGKPSRGESAEPPRHTRPPRVRRRRRRAPRPSRVGTSLPSTGERFSPWVIVGALFTLATPIAALNRGCASDRMPVHDRTLRAPEPVSAPTSLFRASPDPWRAHLPSTAPDRISGVVLFAGRQAVPHVELTLTTGSGSTMHRTTNAHGVFVFDHVQASTGLVEVRGNVHLGAAPPDGTRLQGGTRGAIVKLHPHRTILLELPRSPALQRGDASLQVARTNGPQRELGSWSLDRRTALITGLEPAAYYDVLVRCPERKRAGLVERVAAGQRVEVTLQRSTTVHGRIEVPVGASLDDLEVLLTHGRLVVPARVTALGWQADHLPRGSWWDVTARRTGYVGAREAVQTGIHAGVDGPVVLDLR